MRSSRHFTRFVRALSSALVITLIAALPALRGAEKTAPAEPLVGIVYAVAVSGNDVYVGGSFTSIGNISANNIAKYNRATNVWSAVGGGANSAVSAIAINGADVYIGGRFTNAKNPDGTTVPATCVIRWSAAGNTFNPLGASGVNTNGVNGDVQAILVTGNGVYVGGTFTTARNSGSDTVSANSVVRWTGTSWAALGTGSSTTGNGISSPGSPVAYSLAVSGSDVYVGGSFTRVHNSGAAAAISANCVAKWNTTNNTWSALGTGSGGGANGVNGDVLAMAVNGADLYIGGNFTNAYNNAGAAVNSQNVARWNGSSWSALGTGVGPGGNGVNGTVNAIVVGSGFIYVGGDYQTAYNGSGGGVGVNSVSANYVARWSGTAWSALGQNSGSTGNGVDGQVTALNFSANTLITGGEFESAYTGNNNKITVGNIAQWNGTAWTALGPGSPGGGAVTTVSAASFSGADLAPESIAAAYGVGLATATQAATASPLPTSLGGSTVKIKDAAGVERSSPLFFVSPTQINLLIPAGTAAGAATVTITASDGKVSTGTVRIAPVSPAIFTANANGQGVAAATAFRLRSNGAQAYEPVARFDTGQNKFVSVPVNLGPTTDQVFLVLNGSGIRSRSALSAVTAQIGGTAAEVLYAGPQGLVGLDQINVRIPRDLIGRGEVNVALFVDGKPANLVTVNVQ